jgi:hypothetical protein
VSSAGSSTLLSGQPGAGAAPASTSPLLWIGLATFIAAAVCSWRGSSTTSRRRSWLAIALSLSRRAHRDRAWRSRADDADRPDLDGLTGLGGRATGGLVNNVVIPVAVTPGCGRPRRTDEPLFGMPMRQAAPPPPAQQAAIGGLPARHAVER